MNTQKSVYNKLFKEETQLASHSVELATFDDFTKESSIVVKGVDAGNTLVKQASQILKDAATKYQQAIGSNQKAIQFGEKIINDAKALGIPAPDVLVKSVGMLQTRLKDLQAAADRINKQANGTYGITK